MIDDESPYISQKEHEEISAGLLLKFISSQEEKIYRDELRPSDLCGSQAGMIDELIFCFFDNDRKTSGIPIPSSLWTISDLMKFIVDQVLPVMAERRPDLLGRDWQGGWEFLPDEEDIF